MRIHTLDNESYNLDTLPEEVDDMRFAVLDNSDNQNPDYFYIPLIYLESFTAPALVLKIGERKIKMPLDWSVLIGESDLGDLEALPLTSLNSRNFNVYQYNSLSSFSPTFMPIEIVDVYNEVQWFVPKLKNGQYLAVPIEDGDNPQCVYFIRDVSRNCEVIDYNKAWG